MKIDYEKVTESIFEYDFKDDLAHGVLYCKVNNSNTYEQLYLTEHFYYAIYTGQLYRRIEKPIDWRERVCEYVNTLPEIFEKKMYIVDNIGLGIQRTEFTEQEFLNMCRTALRATGEIE